MATLNALKKDLERALKGGDLDQVASVRRTIAEGFPDEAEAAEANYKLGLDALFRSRDMDAAANYLRASAKAKNPVWSPTARMSLGLILLRQQKHQQAVFELRRVAGGKKQDLVAAQAWGLIVVALREQKNAKEADRARAQQLRLLTTLGKSADLQEAALANLTLGLERKFDGERAPAKTLIQKALESGTLGPDETRQAQSALEDL